MSMGAIASTEEEQIELILRPYRPGDVDAMHALDVQCFDPVFRFSRRAMEKFAESPGSFCVLGEMDGVLAGFAIVEMDHSQRKGYLITLDVAPALRRCGVGARLMAEIEERAVAEDVATLELHVYVGNRDAIRFYERMNFTQIGRVRSFYGRGMDALHCGKRL